MSEPVTTLAEKLNQKIPRDAISSRDGGNGRKLDYLSGHYVIDRLNRVLGAGNWAYSSEANLVHAGLVPTRSGDAHSVHYLAKVRLVVTLDGTPTEFTDYGYGDGTDKSNPGKAHELAVKESVTDGLKRCAKNLGMSFGLALYSKDQENVEESEPVAAAASSGAGRVSSAATAKPVPAKAAIAPAAKAVKAAPVQAAVPSGPSRETVLKKISLTSRVIIDSKRRTQEEVVAMLQAYGVKAKEELNDEQASKLLTQLEEYTK